MDQSNGWGLPRYVALFVVLALHLALLAALLMPARTQIVSEPTEQAVELIILPPANLPKIRSESARPQHLTANNAIAIAPPVFDETSPQPAASGSGDAGRGPGVDWTAEARRAVQAFDIRNHQPVSNTISGSPAEEHWWPRTRHHTGDQFKTPSGDWIVWVSDECYQIASSAANAAALGAVLPQTVCIRELGGARSEPGASSNKISSHGEN